MEERELEILFAAGDEGALSQLLAQYGPLMRYIIRGILIKEEEREECWAQLSLLIWEKRGVYRPDKGPLKPWLATLARNTALNQARRLGREHWELTDSIPDFRPGPEEELLSQERGGPDPAGGGRAEPAGPESVLPEVLLPSAGGPDGRRTGYDPPGGGEPAVPAEKAAAESAGR